MSLSAISSNPMTGSQTASFHPHRKGAHGVNSSATASSTPSNTGALGNTSGVTIGQLPVGASSPLFNNILQSLQQTIGAQSAVTAAASSSATSSSGASAASGTTAASSGTTANVHAFMHTLFQALKQDGFDPGAAAASSPATASSGLVSSLKTLIGQVGTGAAVTPAAASLSAAYQALVGANGASGPAGTSSANGAATASSGGGLQHFLGNLLQNLQSGGVHALSAVGNNVNANV